MANIMIIGFRKNEAKSIREKIETLIRKLGKSTDSITTIVPAKTRSCRLPVFREQPLQSPYLIVRHTKIAQAREIATALHKKLNLDTEYEKIAGFLARIILEAKS